MTAPLIGFNRFQVLNQDYLLQLIGSRFTELRVVELATDLITPNVLHELAAKCPHLWSMTLGKCTVQSLPWPWYGITLLTLDNREGNHWKKKSTPFHQSLFYQCPLFIQSFWLIDLGRSMRPHSQAWDFITYFQHIQQKMKHAFSKVSNSFRHSTIHRASHRYQTWRKFVWTVKKNCCSASPYANSTISFMFLSWKWLCI